jgi:hypothetical protein
VRRIPLAHAAFLRPLARRTAVVRAVLAVATVALATAAVVWATRLDARESVLLPTGSDGFVVLDVSASISSDTYARIAATIDRLVRSEGRYGLILFSDVAYEALPPGTPARELRAFERFFVVPEQQQPGLLPVPPLGPWTDAFSGGTRISTGLQLALDRIRSGNLDQPAVLLVSDLDDDPADLESLTTVALELRRLGAPLRVAGLNPAPEDARFMERLLSRGSRDLTPVGLPGEEGGARRQDVPAWLIAAALAFAALLALNELAGARFRWEPVA